LLKPIPAQIEFPSILLPPDIHSGSIVDINVTRNQHAEALADQSFSALQDEIYSSFGKATPSPPVLRCRNTTQTSVVLEWDPIELATAELRSLSLYRNGTKAGTIPKDKLSTKISGLALDTEYTFHLVLRTSAGQYSSEKLKIKTHKMTDLTGITITPGVMAPQLKDSLAETVNKIGAKLIDTVRIDTTHFVCTEPRGQAWEKAVEMNVPVVVPDWVKGCEREGRIVGVRGYYLDADPKLRQMGPSQQVMAAQRLSPQQGQQQQQQMRESPRIEHTPPTPERTTHDPNGFPPSGTAVPQRPAEERLAEERAEDAASESAPREERRVSTQAEEVEDSDDDDEEESRPSDATPVAKAKPATADDEDDDEDDEDEDERDGRADGGDGKFDEVAL
jgi:chitin biosynthesis protein CHS5